MIKTGHLLLRAIVKGGAAAPNKEDTASLEGMQPYKHLLLYYRKRR